MKDPFEGIFFFFRVIKLAQTEPPWDRRVLLFITVSLGVSRQVGGVCLRLSLLCIKCLGVLRSLRGPAGCSIYSALGVPAHHGRSDVAEGCVFYTRLSPRLHQQPCIIHEALILKLVICFIARGELQNVVPPPPVMNHEDVSL